LFIAYQNYLKGLSIFELSAFYSTMNSLLIGIFLLLLPLAFAGGLVYFMMSGKGTKPLENKTKNPEGKNKETDS